MSDGQVLFAVVCIIYLTDCLHWMNRHSFYFTRWVNMWKCQKGAFSLGFSSGNIVMVNPLPPLSQIISSYPLPLAISPVGIASGNADFAYGTDLSDAGVSITFEEMDSVRTDGKDLLINEIKFATLQSESMADEFCERLLQLKGLSGDESRESEIRSIMAERFNFDAASTRLIELRKMLPALTLGCNVFFIVMFILFPVSCIFFGLSNVLLLIIISIIPFELIILLEFARNHRRFYPTRRYDRITGIVKMALCPISLIRAGDLISNDLLSRYDPIVVAHLVLDKTSLADFASNIIRFMYNPIISDQCSQATSNILSYYRIMLKDTIERYLFETAQLEKSLINCLPRKDEGASSFCPRCLSQFSDNVNTCPDCPDIKLIKFNLTSG